MPTDATTRTAPYGSWPSPVSADLIAGATIRFGQLALRGTDILWTEGRPQEQGRNVLVERRADGQARDLNPPPTNVRTRAHEYGGGAFVALPDGVVFCNYDDQQLYRIDAAGAVRQLTRDVAQRYADMVPDLARARLIAVREDHAGGDIDAVSTLVAISLVDGSVQVLAQGDDFYSSPTLSPDGRQLAWLSWNHPNMPWDGTTLWQSEISADGSLAGPRQVAGGPRESVFQPCWSPQGELHFVSDRSGWWNLYRLRSGKTQSVMPMSAEFGTPQWVFGMTTYGFDGAGRIVCSYASAGTWRIALLSPDDGGVQRLELPYCAIDGLKVGADFAVFVGATPTRPAAIVRLELASGTCVELRNSSSAEVDPAFVSRAEAIAFPTEGGLTAHAFYYPPTHRELRGPEGERAPLIVISHGGPTAASDAAFKWSHQYWTSRGFAVVDVNYGGSSGYGRAYRERLNGRWGVVDVDDAVHAARYLVARGDVHPERVAIRGGSAGGYTTLCALTFRDFFKAGASHYGIGDLEALATDTHKFESRYLDRLVGPYPAQRALYRERSPIHHTDRLAAPMILFQGAEDKAVPPAQAEQMAAAVDAKGLPVAYLLFEGEQHGFRRAATIKRVLEAELYFYGRVFGFEPADTIEPVEIRNLPR